MIAPGGIFLIEIKNWSGRLDGDPGTWTQTRVDGTVRPKEENPLRLADRKAKRLKSLLCDQPALSGASRPPFIQALVFLSHRDLDCQLSQPGRQDVYGLDAQTQLPGILERIVSQQPRQVVDANMAGRVKAALEQAGIRPPPVRRR